MLENLITSTPLPRQSLAGSSGGSSIRRSLVAQIRVVSATDEERNDDDAERSSLVASERAVASSTPSQSPRRATMSSSPQKAHFQGCLKLYAENKINKDNAWNLQLIDFMSTMLRRHDSRMENLQTASTVVDASARIYSFRVDAVHFDVLKMAGGLSKAHQSKRGKKDDDACAQDEGAADTEGAAPAKKKKKRSKGAVSTNPAVFNGDFDANEYIDPFFERLAATTGDVMSSNRAFNATLPISDLTLGLVLRTDINYLESVKENVQEEIDFTYGKPLAVKFSSFTHNDVICEPFNGFSISNWDPETEDTHLRVSNWVDDNRLNLSQQALAFDMNADVEPIPQDEPHNDLYDEPPLAGLESDEEADVGVAACVQRLPAAPPARLTDMRPAAPADTRLEYSYTAIVAAWAGPAHWRLNRASKLSERTQTSGARLTVDGTGKKPARTKRQLDFLCAGLAFDSRAATAGDYAPAPPGKIIISRKTLAHAPNWDGSNLKTTIDRGLDESHFRKLFLRRRVALCRAAAGGAGGGGAGGGGAEDAPRDYNYDNENDASYCVNNAPFADEWGNEDATAAGDPHEQVKAMETEEIGDMLEPPTKIAKIFIPYAMRAKKVDMKQLKHCTWKMLTEKTSECEKSKVDPTTFFNIYSRLPSKLTPNMRESLSVPLALLSVLHLANEKGLILEKKDDLSDIGIVGLIK